VHRPLLGAITERFREDKMHTHDPEDTANTPVLAPDVKCVQVAVTYAHTLVLGTVQMNVCFTVQGYSQLDHYQTCKKYQPTIGARILHLQKHLHGRWEAGAIWKNDWTLEEMELEDEKRSDDVQNYDRGRGRRVSSKMMSNLMKRVEEGRQTDVESELDDQPRSQPRVDEKGGENYIIGLSRCVRCHGT
jgi:hypothetical protein